MPLRTLAPFLLSLVASSALGVVIDTGDGTGNTAAPADDFGFESVGFTSTNLSGIYLGDTYVLTANHVNARPITFAGIEYQPLEGSGVRLANPSSPHPDLFVYRVNGHPNVPPVVLSNASPGVGETVTCLGHGWNRQPTATRWNALWQEEGEPGANPPWIHDGYEILVGFSLRWGRNEVSETGVDVDLRNAQGTIIASTRTFFADFDESGGVADEFQAVTGDSGGACFAKRSGTWELVGVMYAIATLQGQPNATAVFGDRTLVADVFHYRSQIESLTPPHRVPALTRAGSLALGIALLAGVRWAIFARPARR